MRGDFDEDEDDDCCLSCDGEGGCHDCGEDTCNCIHTDGGPGDNDWIECEDCSGTGEDWS
jgi:hypothetical protein